MLLPPWRRGEEPADVDPARVAPVAAEYGVPAGELVDRLNCWLWTWTRWRETATGRKRAGGAAARALRLRVHAARQSAPELHAQVLDRATPRPAPERREPELTLHLALLWLEHRGGWPAPGSGTKPSEFVRFVTACAVAIGLHAPSDTAAARWRVRWQRERARIASGLRGNRPVQPS